MRKEHDLVKQYIAENETPEGQEPVDYKVVTVSEKTTIDGTHYICETVPGNNELYFVKYDNLHKTGHVEAYAKQQPSA